MIDYIGAETNVIPASATLAEASYYVLQSIEEDYNEMMRGFALNELGVLEATGYEVVYEDNVLLEATNKVAGFTNSNYNKVKAMYGKFLSDQKSKVNSLKAKIPEAKVKKIASGCIESIMDKEYARSYSYANLESAKAGNNSNKICQAMVFLEKAAPSVSEANLETTKSKFASILGANSSAIKDVKAAAINYLRGSDKDMVIDKGKITANFDSMWKSVFDYKTISSEVKGILNNTKSIFSSLSASTKIGGDDAVSKARIKFQKYAAEAIVALNSAILLVYKEQLDTNRKIVWKVSSQCLKNAPKKVPEKEIDEAPVKENYEMTPEDVAEFAKEFIKEYNIEPTSELLLAIDEAGIDITDIIPVTEETEKFESLFDFDLDD